MTFCRLKRDPHDRQDDLPDPHEALMGGPQWRKSGVALDRAGAKCLQQMVLPSGLDSYGQILTSVVR